MAAKIHLRHGWPSGEETVVDLTVDAPYAQALDEVRKVAVDTFTSMCAVLIALDEGDELEADPEDEASGTD